MANSARAALLRESRIWYHFSEEKKNASTKSADIACSSMQIIGTMLGAVVNYVLMASITTNQREILLSTQGTNIWSGQVIQAFNSNVRILSTIFFLSIVTNPEMHRLSPLVLCLAKCSALTGCTAGLFWHCH